MASVIKNQTASTLSRFRARIRHHSDTDVKIAKGVILMVDCTENNNFRLAVDLLELKEFRAYHLHATVHDFSQQERLSSLSVIKVLNKRLFLYQTDVTSQESVKGTVQKVLEMEGRIDILLLHNNSRYISSCSSQNKEIITSVFRHNLDPYLHAISTVLPHMKRERAGRIVAVNSYAGQQGLAYSSSYCASRFAIDGYLQSLANELLSHNVHISVVRTCIDSDSSICPVVVASDMTSEKVFSDEERDDFEEYQTQLQKRKLYKTVKVSKLANTIKSILQTNNPEFQYFVNKGCEVAAREKFCDVRNTQNLSEAAKVFLSLDVCDIRPKTSTCSMRGPRRNTFPFVSRSQPREASIEI